MTTVQFRPIRKIDKAAFEKDLEDSLPQVTTIADYDRTLQTVLDRHAPLCEHTFHQRKATPWFNDIAEQFSPLKQERRRAERRYRKSGQTVDKEIFEKIKRSATDLVDSAKTAFYSAKIKASKTCKEMFKNFNTILGKTPPSHLPKNHKPESLPSVFSDYFTDKIRAIRNNFPPPDLSLPVDDPSYNGSILEFFTPVSKESVLEIIKNTSPKCCDLDPIPISLLYENLDVFVPILTNIINASLISGTVPSELKNAIVKPLLKKTNLDQNVLKNYRPVSNLPFVSKILEKVVLKQLLTHLQDNNLCNAFQSAYRTGHSTETVLLRIVNDLLTAMDSDDVSMLLLLDLSAAFDTIDHDILLSRLECTFGIRSTALQWFRSYLLGRYQFVSVNGVSSSPSPLLFGVPQGSVLGPVLFVLYTTPLSELIKKCAVNHQLFADDTQLQQSCPPSGIQTLRDNLHHCTTRIKTWMNNNKLKLNDDKTEAMLFSPPNMPPSCSLPSSVTVGAHDILCSKTARNLGFIFDSELSMKHHVTKVCQTAFYELKRISSIRRYLTEDATKTLVTSSILSRLDYCNSLLMGAPFSVIQPMQRVQNSAARLVLKASRQEPITPLLQKLHWLPVSERIKYKTCCLCFSSVTGTAPSYLADLLPIYTSSRSGLRSSSDSRIIQINNNYKRKRHGFRSLACYGPQLWNTLPYKVRHSQTTDSFKTSLKTHLFKNCYNIP